MESQDTRDLVTQLQSLSGELETRFRAGTQENGDINRVHALHIVQSAARRFATPLEFARSQTWAQLEIVGSAIACEMGIFSILSDSESPLSVSQLADRVQGGADELLVHRVVRFLAAHGMVDQISLDQYRANHVTHDYASPYRKANVLVNMHCTHSYLALPSFLQKSGFQSPTNIEKCAWQEGLCTSNTFWQSLKADREFGQNFNMYMAAARSTNDNLAAAFPFDEIFQGSGPDEVLFVDVGGGLGHQSLNIRRSFPRSRGRVVLQDLPQVVEGVSIVDVEVMSLDIMTGQPLSGARVYYFRGVLHDHDDDACRNFLSHTVLAMAPKSRLLVHEALVGDYQPMFGGEDITRRDLGMMAQFAGMERSETQMKSLLEGVGLKVLRVHKPETSIWSIVEATLLA